VKNYISSLNPEYQYFILTTTRIGSQPSYNIKYFFGEVEEKQDDYVLFHNINSNVSVRAAKVYDTGHCSYYSDTEIESDCSLEGVIRKNKEYEYYILSVECYGERRLDIIKPDRSTQLSLISKESNLIFQSQNIGSFCVESSNKNITDIMKDIEDITEDTSITISSFSPIEERMFYSTYDRYLNKYDITAETVNGFKIRTNEKFRITNLYKN